MIDYSICVPWHNHVRATFMIESNERIDAVGDSGLALGPGQIHPTFFIQYYGLTKPYPAQNHDSWVTAWLKATANFFELHQESGVDLCVQAYRLGWHAVLYGVEGVNDGQPQRDPHRLSRFYEAMNKIHSGKAGA